MFRIFRLGKRLKSEVLSRLLTLVFTLVAVIVTAAGVFYEIETRFGVRGAPLLGVENACRAACRHKPRLTCHSLDQLGCNRMHCPGFRQSLLQT